MSAREDDRFLLRSRGITDARVRSAMARVPRAAFVLAGDIRNAHADAPLSIGFGQTISQPFIVAWMTQELRVEPGARVLEVGTGSGYQTAILAELGAEVFSLEIVPELSTRAAGVLAALGYSHVHLQVASGYDGWVEHAPFDRIVLTAAPPRLPRALVEQLADGGRLVAPIGEEDQVIVVMDRRGTEYETRQALPVRFVPMR